MYRARDAPQIWPGTVRERMAGLDFRASALHLSVYWRSVRLATAVLHVDDFLFIGSPSELQWLPKSLQKEYDLKKSLLEPESENEVRYLNRMLRRGAQGVERECDPKHMRTLVREHGMEGCKGKGTPMTTEGPNKSMGGKPLDPERPSKARKGIDNISYVAQDRPDLAVTARVLSPQMASPTEGTEVCPKRAIHDLASTLEEG